MRFGVLRFARGLRMVQRSWSCLVSVRLRVIGCGRARPGMYRVRRIPAASVSPPGFTFVASRYPSRTGGFRGTFAAVPVLRCDWPSLTFDSGVPVRDSLGVGSAALYEGDDFQGVGAFELGLCTQCARHDFAIEFDGHTFGTQSALLNQFGHGDRRGDVLFLAIDDHVRSLLLCGSEPLACNGIHRCAATLHSRGCPILVNRTLVAPVDCPECLILTNRTSTKPAGCTGGRRVDGIPYRGSDTKKGSPKEPYPVRWCAPP